jgi:toxin ParE1/3/4
VRVKPVIPREAARADVEEAVAYYVHEGVESAALGFIEHLAGAYASLSRHPSMGSTRYAHELDLPELRAWTLSRYPFVIFYVERPDHVDVWRVLHGKRDIPAWLRQDAPPQ